MKVVCKAEEIESEIEGRSYGIGVKKRSYAGLANIHEC